ncbi:hypothetical protein TNCT_105421 [Trichonephila clavata]|uniref:Uncharacterized protein n=1 Tax=Trichonephila clavata TaxID=2740835 RepID=A0A8X6KI28_TRICU|nr:hypothetical protein TNCT_105421 [Trichonephila clavata]
MQTNRKRPKEEQVKQPGPRYNSPCILREALAKVKRNLPVSPTKAVEFVKKLLLNSKLLYFTKMMPLKLCFENWRMKEKNRFKIFIIGHSIKTFLPMGRRP